MCYVCEVTLDIKLMTSHCLCPALCLNIVIWHRVLTSHNKAWPQNEVTKKGGQVFYSLSNMPEIQI